MDYTKGAIDLDRRAAVRLIINKLGPQVAAPTGALFTEDHLVDMMNDLRYYALTPENSERLHYDVIDERLWIKNIQDCDNRANKALNDLSDHAVNANWKANCLTVVLSYVSKSLKKDRTGVWDGYHAALLNVKWEPKLNDFSVWVVEPKYIWESGATRPEKWQTPLEEVQQWVSFTGR